MKFINILVLMLHRVIAPPSLIETATPVITEGNYSLAIIYLTKFGYVNLPSSMSKQTAAMMSEDILTTAIKKFQNYAGLKQTGKLDRETQEVMHLPRCGVKDFVGSGEKARKKRFALQGSRWSTKQLTYKITKFPEKWKMSRTDVKNEIQRAFDIWSTVTDLNFTLATKQPHIEVRFEEGEHGDGDSFDGEGGTLAHAYYPIYGGDAHFDSEEQWTINSYYGTNLFQVAAHEFGHSLGLSHSNIRDALMAPFYRDYVPEFNLHDDDMSAIQRIYGPKTSVESTTATSKKESPGFNYGTKGNNDDLCTDGSFDAVTNSTDGYYYFFKGDKYWKIKDYQVVTGYPRKLSRDWLDLPKDIDAAFYMTYSRNNIFLKGSQVWSYKSKVLEPGYPKYISSVFPGIPNNIDAAFIWGGNGKLYFFKGANYWRFDFYSKPNVNPSYPRSISKWNGIPNHLDAVLTDKNGYTYFFKNGSYWRFNDVNFRVDDVYPPYPRPTGKWWFGCSSSSALPEDITERSDYDDYNEVESDSEKSSFIDILMGIFGF